MKKWQCSVCGYIHQGDTPPDHCPVCGTDRSRFLPVNPTEEASLEAGSAAPEPSPTDATKWQCAVCGYAHTGPTPPDACPVCGSEGRRFDVRGVTPRPTPPTPDGPESHPVGQDLRWQCSVCGYIHTGPEPPEQCPVCGADKSQFVQMDAPGEAIPADAPSAANQASPSGAPAAAAFLAPYRRWIDLAIEYHAHPIAVHIPNGVLPITVAMVLLAALFDWPAMGHVATYNMGFILLSMPVVLFTGYLHWQFKFGGNVTGLFKWKIICGASVLVLSFILFTWGMISPESARHPGALYLLLHFFALVVAGIAGWLGGKLVFRSRT